LRSNEKSPQKTDGMFLEERKGIEENECARKEISK
jgi:hypothetical protein